MAPPVSELRSDAQGGALYYLPPISSRAAQKLWGSLASCAPVVYRCSWRVANPPQAASLPHIKRIISYFGGGSAALCHLRPLRDPAVPHVDRGIAIGRGLRIVRDHQNRLP